MTEKDYQDMLEELKRIEKDLNELASSMDVLAVTIETSASRSWTA